MNCHDAHRCLRRVPHDADPGKLGGNGLVGYGGAEKSGGQTGLLGGVGFLGKSVGSEGALGSACVSLYIY